jgi:hypothetical protein
MDALILMHLKISGKTGYLKDYKKISDYNSNLNNG